jgi:hypothetical protein
LEIILLDGNQDIGCFKVAILYQSTSETKISGCLPVHNSGFALFYLFGNYLKTRKNAQVKTGNISIDPGKQNPANAHQTVFYTKLLKVEGPRYLIRKNGGASLHMKKKLITH